MRRGTHRRWACALGLVGVGVMIGSGAGVMAGSSVSAAAESEATTPADLPAPTEKQLNNSVQRWEPGGVMEWNTSDSVTPLATNKKEGSDAVITLASDILFDFNSADISDRAAEAIANTVENVPEGTKVTVSGYTDSVGDNSANKKLSKKRAQAVADVIADSRSDLELSVEGHGEADPVAKNSTKDGKDNPQGRAKNRRVEVSYADD
ncbi:OmpA family protein [Brevibacterium renqingii]|uniref:OmpA family protein n=1 Tax=Brevibacterium renqingii TaxID=2776916 RepID=UPI001ADF8030|nr:OmpA family protein [Brevibacterium renqingii]